MPIMTLTPYAQKVLSRSGARVDPGQTCSEDALCETLRTLGLPIYEPVVELERVFGGLVWKDTVYGTFAAVQGRSAKDVWSIGGRFWNEPEIYEGQIVLPISKRENGDVDFWMMESGRILFSPEIYTIPVAESGRCFFERLALKANPDKDPTIILRWRAIPAGTPDDYLRFGDVQDDSDEEEAPAREYSQDLQRRHDRQLAELVGLPLLEPASDRWMNVWFDGERLLYPYYPWEPADRLIRVKVMDQLVAILQAALAVRPVASVVWEGPLGEPPQPGEQVAVEVPSIDERDNWTGHLLLVGSPGCYRACERRFEQPRNLARLWEQRREAWLAER